MTSSSDPAGRSTESKIFKKANPPSALANLEDAQTKIRRFRSCAPRDGSFPYLFDGGQLRVFWVDSRRISSTIDVATVQGKIAD